MQGLAWDVFETPMGWSAALVSEKGVRATTLPRRSPEEALAGLGKEAAGARHDPGAVQDVRERLQAFFGGRPVAFDDIPLDLSGAPPFFQAAWRACAAIPMGETRTYKWLATQAGNPAAVRAAGQAMARNPVAPIIPCHRVIGSSGKLHGYGGGLEMKDRLLLQERPHPRAGG